MKKIRVIISTNGPLHLVKSAERLVNSVDVQVIQGWIPGKISKFLLPIINRIVGRDLSKSLKKRIPESLNGKNKSVSLPEFFFWFTRFFLNINSDFYSAKLYGLLSQRYIKNAEIFHVRSGSGQSAIAKAKRLGMKVVVDHSIAHPAFMDKHLRTEYDNHGVKFDLGNDSLFWQSIIKDCDQADCLLVNSEFVKETFIEKGYNSKKIKVIVQGVRDDFFYLKTDYSLKSPIKILFTGSFSFRKGAEYLLKALQKLDEENIEYEMIIVGSYEGSIDLLNKYKPKHISFKGQVLQDELKSYLAESDIYLFPSLSEGCASSGMEAMAAGIPVISTRESGLPIEDQIDGVIIPSKDVNAITKAITKLANDFEKRKSIGENAARKISNHFNWNVYVKNLCDIYTNL